MTKFTKGEWIVSDNKINSPVRHVVKMPNSKPTKYNGTMYSCIGGFDSETQSEEAEANAYLISAAPDMYAMIKEVADMQKQWYGYGIDTHMKLAKMADKMESLLKAARGE